MRRPVVRLLLTLLAAASILGTAPATSEAGIIPWAWDTLFGPVGSIQARHAGYYGGGYYGGGYDGCCGSTQYVGFRGWRNRACCGTYGDYYAGGYGYSNCGSCSSCGTGSCGLDCGYGCGSAGCGVGNCASGQCNVNYPPGTNSPAGGASPVTPAPPPGTQGGPTPYENSTTPPVPPVAPEGDASKEGFQPRKGPAPPAGDPTQGDNFVPPKVNTETDANSPKKEDGTGTNGNSTVVPPVAPGAKKKDPLGDDEDGQMGRAPGPRLEMQDKVTRHNTVVRVRQAQAPTRVTASANRTGMFPKIAWRSMADTDLAKK